MTSSLEDVISGDDRAKLESIATELQQREIPAERRVALLEIAAEIAEKYSCDTRLHD